MLLESELLSRYAEEIAQIEENERYLDSSPGKIYFGLFSGEILKAFATLKCYQDENGEDLWMLRGCFAKKEFRGEQNQLELIEKRLEYLRSLPNPPEYVWTSIHPDNEHSRNNIEKAGFKLVTTVLLDNGELVWRYKLKL